MYNNIDKNGQQKRKRIKRYRLGDVIAAILLMVVVGVLVCAFISFLRYNSLKLVQADYGVFEETIPIEIIVIRNEYLVTADTNGEFLPLLSEGERVKENGVIGQITREATDSFQAAKTVIYAKHSGMISYNIDGWENILQPDLLGQMDWLRVLSLLRSQFSADPANQDSKINDVVSADPQTSGNDKSSEISDIYLENLSEGRSIAKIVDNLIDYQVFVYCSKGIDGFADNNSINIKLSLEDDPLIINGDVIESGILSDGSGYMLLSVSSATSALFEYRYADAMILGSSVEGIIIPYSSIIEVSGSKNVYIQKKRNIVLKQIEVVATSGDYAIVEGVSTTDFVVTNPQKAKNGQKIY